MGPEYCSNSKMQSKTLYERLFKNRSAGAVYLNAHKAYVDKDALWFKITVNWLE